MTTTSQTPVPLVATNGNASDAPPRIYVACLAAYNAGRLHGRWVRADRGEAHIWDKTRAMLRESPEPCAEEWAIHDYDGFESVTISEHAGFDTVCALADFIAERGALGAAVLEHLSNDVERASSAFEDYAGCYASLAEFAESLIRETGPEIPDTFQFYIDWLAMGQDMALNGDVFTIETYFSEVHVFWCR